MAYQDALSIFKSNRTDEDELRIAYASVVDQIQLGALSTALKSQESQLSGDPMAGSVNVRRLMTSTVRDYGTARTASEGDKIANNGVVVLLDTPKEIVEEVNKWDLDHYGLAGVVSRRAQNFGLATARHLDTAFFAEAEAEGEEVTITQTDLVDQVEELIQDLETEANDNVDGVNRELMDLTLSPLAYGLMQNYIDTLPNPNAGGVDIRLFHNVRVWSNTRQTEDAILMVRGSIAQPVAIIDFAEGDIPLSAERALQMFFKYGTKAVMPDLIRYATLVSGS